MKPKLRIEVQKAISAPEADILTLAVVGGGFRYATLDDMVTDAHDSVRRALVHGLRPAELRAVIARHDELAGDMLVIKEACLINRMTDDGISYHQVDLDAAKEAARAIGYEVE